MPDNLSAAEDDAILASVRRRQPLESVREDGDPVVFSRGADALEEAAARFVAAREAFEAAQVDARAAAVAAADAGEMSEHALARLLGVERMTIRAWRGKGR